MENPTINLDQRLNERYQMASVRKQRLKTPKGLSKTVNWGKADNTMPKQTRHTMSYKTLHRKLKIEQHDPH